MCEDLWWYGDNPYAMDPKTPLGQICSGIIVNITGTTLRGIMEVMKFAYHLADERDFEDLKDKILKANYTYSFNSSSDVSVISISCFYCIKMKSLPIF